MREGTRVSRPAVILAHNTDGSLARMYADLERGGHHVLVVEDLGARLAWREPPPLEVLEPLTRDQLVAAELRTPAYRPDDREGVLVNAKRKCLSKNARKRDRKRRRR